MSLGPSPDRWAREGELLVCPVQVHADLRTLARDTVAAGLRSARAPRWGLHHPLDARLEADRLTLRLGPSRAPDRGPTPFARWRDRRLLPLLDVLLRCHARGIAGFDGPVAGRWVPPPGWFLPPPGPPPPETLAADRGLLRAWTLTELASEAPRHPADQGLIRGVLSALDEGDEPRLQGLLDDERRQAALRAAEHPEAPSFLSLLTEAELFERLTTVYRYRVVPEDELDALGLEAGALVVLEVETGWRDPAFPPIARPSPQELWDALVDASRTTPELILSEMLPNPLAARRAGVSARWIKVHDDQPLLFVRRDAEEIPPEGFVRPHLTGDVVLMERKRRLTAFAGEHPGIEALLALPAAPHPFHQNPQPRADLEEAVLATRGVFAVQGPPGTGKTHLATEVVRRFLARNPAGRVLVCAKEHFALDHINRKICAALERDGVPFRAFRSVSMAKRRRSRAEVDDRWLATSVARELGQRGWTPEQAGWADWQASVSAAQDQRLAGLGLAAANLVFATTMDSLLVELLDTDSFDLVIVEEAGKCYPSELLHALCLGRTALMIGDQRQLPPYQERRTREAIDAWERSLARASEKLEHHRHMALRFGAVFESLHALHRATGRLGEAERSWVRPFEHLFDRLSTRHRLEEQFRMEAPLSDLVGQVFYGRPFQHRKGELVASGLLSARPLGEALPPELDVPLLWIDTPHMVTVPEATEDDQKRGVRDNAYEANLVVRYLTRLRAGVDLDLVILTPYNAQKALLLGSEALRGALARVTRRSAEEVVRTTDEYQGREAELTILSLVRNNSQGARAWGFMTEPERLNVMFSRARFRQVVIGCSAHIERHKDEAADLFAVWAAYRASASDPARARILRAEEVARG